MANFIELSSGVPMWDTAKMIGTTLGGVVSPVALWQRWSKHRAEAERIRLAQSAAATSRGCVTQVIVRSGALVDQVQFVYRDGSTMVYGGEGGTAQETFVLDWEAGEHITAVSGYSGQFIDSIQFETNTGRQSPLYGGRGGGPFLMRGPPGGVAGLQVTTSPRGWLKRLTKVLPLDQVQLPRGDEFKQNMLKKLRAKVILNFMELCMTTLMILATVLWPYSSLIWDFATGPLPLNTSKAALPNASNYLSLPLVGNTTGLPRSDGEWGEYSFDIFGVKGYSLYRYRWALVDVPDDAAAWDHLVLQSADGLRGILVKELVDYAPVGDAYNEMLSESSLESRSEATVAVGVSLPLPLSETDDNEAWNAQMEDTGTYELANFLRQLRTHVRGGHDLVLPTMYLDTSYGRTTYMILYACMAAIASYVTAMLLSWGCHHYAPSGYFRALSAYHLRRDPVYTALEPYARLDSSRDLNAAISELESSIEAEIMHPDTLILHWRANRVVVTESWLIKMSQSSMNIVAIDDAQIPRGIIMQQYEAGEEIHVHLVHIHNRAVPAEPFSLSLPTEIFDSLQQKFLDRVDAAREASAQERAVNFIYGFETLLRIYLADGKTYTMDGDLPECLGGCGELANVKITKQCSTCPERTQCLCEPAWCHRCIFKWWQSENKTRILYLEEAFHPSWQAKCPTCRAYFCLNDILPCAGITIKDEQDDNASDPGIESTVEHDDTKVIDSTGDAATEESALVSTTSDTNADATAILTNNHSDSTSDTTETAADDDSNEGFDHSSSTPLDRSNTATKISPRSSDSTGTTFADESIHATPVVQNDAQNEPPFISSATDILSDATAGPVVTENNTTTPPSLTASAPASTSSMSERERRRERAAAAALRRLAGSRTSTESS